MNERLRACLNGDCGSCLAPFFWQMGGGRDQLLAELDAIERSGMREFCVESRIYEDFCGEKWWGDFGFLLEEAKRRGMRVWLLDDKAFPTGYANGYIHEGSDLVRKLLREEHMDIRGPQRDAAVLADRCREGEELLEVVACRRTGEGEALSGEYLLLTDHIRDGIVYFDVPEGMWRVFFLIRTRGDIVSTGRDRVYIDMLSKDSCAAMLKGVYEPHYRHFSAYFGNTFAGFFSDEPSFKNESGTYESKLGKRGMMLPWSGALISLMARAQKTEEEKIRGLLPGLWYDVAQGGALVRCAYMDAVTSLYRENFSDLLGDWCRAHSVMYIGHVIEDMNTHMRLGYGSGHFFRALEGQDMSGIDVVLHQIMMGMPDMIHAAPITDHGVADPEFFDYALAKLGASLAHIDPKKKGKCMCEIFGAYGWAEGLPVMKYLADHMLVNGMNFFVPHAFSPKYPNDDCPPHFWANGNNPQFDLFGSLMRYMTKVAHLLTGGPHRADVAVFYNAEGEWSGGSYMLFQKVAKALTTHQIDFDILPADVFTGGEAAVTGGSLTLGGERYRALLMPYMEYIPDELLERLRALADRGLPVIFVDALPAETVRGRTIGDTGRFETVKLVNLADELRSRGFCQLQAEGEHPGLRFYHCALGEAGEEAVFFFNGDMFEDLDTQVELPFDGPCLLYDPWTDVLSRAPVSGRRMRLRLPHLSTVAVIRTRDIPAGLPETSYAVGPAVKPVLAFDISVRNIGEKEFRPYAASSGLINITGPEGLTRFCGEIRYEAMLPVGEGLRYRELNLGRVGETARVSVNGKDCGARIQEPYVFDVSEALAEGDNRLEILVENNPAYRERDRFSRFMALPPSGVLGEITLR